MDLKKKKKSKMLFQKDTPESALPEVRRNLIFPIPLRTTKTFGHYIENKHKMNRKGREKKTDGWSHLRPKEQHNGESPEFLFVLWISDLFLKKPAT